MLLSLLGGMDGNLGAGHVGNGSACGSWSSGLYSSKPLAWPISA